MKILIFLTFIATANSILIECDFNTETTWASIGRVYTCKVTLLNLYDNPTTITGISGTHMSGKSNADVKFVYFMARNALEVIPKGLSDFFPNLFALSFEYCWINNLNGNELEDFPNLEWFSFRFNDLIRVPGNLFATNPNMKYINFSNNKISHVGEGIFYHLRVETLIFGQNVCIDRNAWLASEIPILIETLRVNCPDFEPETTTTTSTTLQQQKCEIPNFENFVCELDEEIQILRLENENFRNQVEALESQVEILKNSHENFQNQMEAELAEQAEKLQEFERIILDLTSRPCTC